MEIPIPYYAMDMASEVIGTRLGIAYAVPLSSAERQGMANQRFCTANCISSDSEA